MFEIPNRRRIFLLRHAEAAYIHEDGSVTDDPRTVSLTELGPATGAQAGCRACERSL